MEGISLAKESGVDGVLAVGGGSVIDTAKAIASGIYLDDVWASFLGKEKIKQALPLFVVLTISATGSECNGNFVITNEETKQKLGNHSPLVYPKVSIMTLLCSEPFLGTKQLTVLAMLCLTSWKAISVVAAMKPHST